MEKHIITENRRNWKWAIKEHKLPIFETRGINPNITSICDEIWNYIISNKAYVKDNVYTYMDIPVTSEFIKNHVNINVIISKTYDSNFAYNRSFLDNKIKKLDNVIINLGVNNFRDKEGFINALSHELMHAYIYWNTLLVPKHNRYNVNLSRYSISSQKSKTTNWQIERDIRNSLYYIFRDENNADFQSLYEYILRNNEINRKNYFEYARKTRIYKIIQYLKTLSNLLDNMSDEGKIVIGHIYKDYLQGDNTQEYNKSENFYFNKYKSKINYTIHYLSDKFYRVIYYALEEAENINPKRIYKEQTTLDPLIEGTNNLSLNLERTITAKELKEMIEEYTKHLLNKKKNKN